MAGHNRWTQIKRKKGAADAKRGQLFSKLSKEITVAARLGGGDPNFNPRLRSAIQAAKSESMPADNIDRAVKKGTGDLAGASAYEELLYEAFGPDGVALLIEVTTDNKNRAAQEVRTTLSRNAGNLGAPGSVAWMFQRRGTFLVENASEDRVLEACLDAGASEVRAEDPQTTGVECPVECFDAVEKALVAAGLPVRESRLAYVPANPAEPSAETATRVLELVDALEDLDDVQRVTTSMLFTEELARQLAESV